MTTTQEPTTTFLWLEVTGRCQLECTHCATSSSPAGSHGSMTVEDWRRVITEGAALGVRLVQFVGGEPTMHPALPELIDHALSQAVGVEVFSNLVHVSPRLWASFSQPGVTLATSYYSDDPDQHAAITQRPTYPRTRANIAEAGRRGITVRAGVIDLGGRQRVEQARAELVDLGVPSIGYDRVRQIGRGAPSGQGAARELCGRCGDGVAAIGPDGEVRPCLFSRWVSIGDVRRESLSTVIDRMPSMRARLIAQGMPIPSDASECRPVSDGTNCYPHNRLVPVGGPCSPESTGTKCYPHEDR